MTKTSNDMAPVVREFGHHDRFGYPVTTSYIRLDQYDNAQKEIERLRVDARRYQWLRDWYHREGKRAEIDPHGHVAVRTLDEWEALLDAAIARSAVEPDGR